MNELDLVLSFVVRYVTNEPDPALLRSLPHRRFFGNFRDFGSVWEQNLQKWFKSTYPTSRSEKVCIGILRAEVFPEVFIKILGSYLTF